MLHLQSPFVQRRTLTAEPLAAELVPTEAELLAADRARAAFKADQRWFAVSDHHALQLEVQRSRGQL
jgi:hypothetical protein